MSKKIQAFVIYAILLDEEQKFSLVWDDNRLIGPASWPLNRLKAYKHTSYQDAWNRLQTLYKENKPALNRISFSMFETTIIKVDDIIIDPIERLNELHAKFSPHEFKRD